MSKIKQKAPKLRFPEFTDDWEQSKLGDVGNTYTGLSGKTADDFGHGEANFITYMNVYSNNIADPTMVSPIEIDEKQHEVEVGDVFFTTSSETPDEVGMSCVLKEKQGIVYLNSFCFGFRPTKSFDLNFLAYMLRSNYVRNQIKILAQGVSRYNISKTKMMDISIIFPDYEEQKKIGEYFSNLDNLITIHQRKCDELKEFKKGMFQKMFPKKGETIPEIRFPGFTDAWEQRKVKEICSISTGKSNTQDRVDEGIYPFYVRSPIVERSNRYLFDEEAVLTVGDGVGTGKVFHYVNGKYDLHQRVYRMFDFSSEINAKYFYYYFSDHFYNRVMSMTAKTSVDSVRYEMIADMDILLPKLNEQIAISNCFDNLDNLITLHQRKVDEYKELKKGLLQQMFI